MGPTRAPRRMFLLNYSQRLSRVYRLPLGDFDLDDLASLRGLHFVLHLHRFDDQYALARGHFVSCAEQHADNFAGHRRRKFNLPACRCSACLPAQMFFIARGDGNSFAVYDHFDGAGRRFFQGAPVDAVVDDDGEHPRLRLADLRFPRRAAEAQSSRAVGQGEFPLDHLPINFEFDFHLNNSPYRSASPLCHGRYSLLKSMRSPSVGWLARHSLTRMFGRGTARFSCCNLTKAVAAARLFRVISRPNRSASCSVWREKARATGAMIRK